MSEEIVKRDDFTPFLLFDKLDDKLIKEELEGKMLGILTYHFNQKGNEIWGLSKAGVDESKAALAKKGEVIRELEFNFNDGDGEAYFNVKAGRYVVAQDGREILLETAFGFKRQPKKYDDGRDNPFWYEQGGIKASRNASMRLIPKDIQQGVIEYAKQKGKVKEVIPEDIPQFAPPKEQPKAQETYRIKNVNAPEGRKSFDIYTTDGKKHWATDPAVMSGAKYAAQENIEVWFEFGPKGGVTKIHPIIPPEVG